MSQNTVGNCGIDEAGRGPVFGPMVISLVCGDPEEFLKIGVKDSKVLSPHRRSEIYESIRNSAGIIEVEVIDAPTINKKMKTMTLNEIEYEIVVSLLKKADKTVYIDSFDTNEKRLQEQLRTQTGKDVICKHKADSTYPSVMAASIISKVTRDSVIEELHQEYGDFGSGYTSDPRTTRFLRESVALKRDISRIVRTEWITYRKLVAGRGNNNLDRF